MDLRTRWVGILMGFAAALTWVSAAGADPNEPNDDLPSATPLACPDALSGVSIDPLGDLDFYQFEGELGERVEIDIDASQFGSSLDPVLGLFDSSGTPIAISDDNPAPGEPFTLDSYLSVPLPSSDTFFVGISSFADFDFDGGGDAFSTGPYDLTLDCTPPPPPPTAGDLLGSTGNRGRALIDIDPATGVGTFRADAGFFGSVTEIEFRDDGVLFGATGGGSSSILTIDPASGAETRLGFHVFGAVNGLEFVGGTLYGTYVPFAGNPSELVIVDQTAGSLTFVGSTGFSNVGGLAYDRQNDELYGVTSGVLGAGQLLSIDRSTGDATVVGSTGLSDLAALEFALDGTLFAGVGGNSISAGSLVRIDPATGAATLVGPTGYPSLSGLAFVPGLPVQIDIQPGKDPNLVDPNASQRVGVAILGSEEFDVADVDPATLTFGPAQSSPSGRATIRDTNDDGFDDLVVRFKLKTSGISSGDEEACLSGETMDGTPFHDCDSLLPRLPPPLLPGPYARPEAWMTGGGRIRGPLVTHGFELHCDPNLGPNKLQVNWGPSAKNSSRFHLEEMTSAVCSDDAAIEQEPPSADFDTHVGAGNGRLNGEPGATAEWVLVDAGEPGKEDTAVILVRDASGAVVLDASGPLKHGNHQAHGAYGALAFGEPSRVVSVASLGVLTLLLIRRVAGPHRAGPRRQRAARR
jgi:hypothetical protein